MNTEGGLLAHVTDAHVAPLGRPTTVLKHHSVAILNDLVDQMVEAGVDCALFGGDNIDNRGHGQEDLDAFAGAVERLESAERSGPRVRSSEASVVSAANNTRAAERTKVVCILGNHEAVSPGRNRVTAEAFARRLDGRGIRPGAYNFVQTVGDVRVIGIDTTLQGTAGGYVSPSTMRFLARALNEGDEAHVVVLGHHMLYRSWEPYSLESWDREYLVANREHVIALLASAPRTRAYLCGHHHASRIQRVHTRGHHGGFYQVLTASPVAYPHHARLLRFGPDGIHVRTITPRIPGVIEEGQDAVLYGRKARRFATLGAMGTFLEYVAGGPADIEAVLPYDAAPTVLRRGVTPAPRSVSVL